MREFVFALEHDEGCNAVADALAAYPDAEIRSLSCHATVDSLWRVDHAEGPPAAIDAIEAAIVDDDHCADCLTTGDCGSIPETEVLDRDEETLVFYTCWQRSAVCSSVPHLALEYLGDGVLFETTREGHRYTWRLVIPDGVDVHAFFDALDDEVCEHTGIELLRLTDLDPGREGAPADLEGDLPEEQAEALRIAVERGYYETPREVELSELAAERDIPRSTLSYRLRRAESRLATNYVRERSIEASAPR